MIRRLGEGGMGVVYEALDREKSVHVAIKTLRWMSADALARFKHEFRALAGLEHRNLCALGELVEADGEWFFSMELVPGDDFLTYVRAPNVEELATESEDTLPTQPRTTRFNAKRLREALAQLAQGLTALHAKDLVHRDIKPANIRVSPDGRVVLLDFGLVTDVVAEDQSWSGADNLVGTPAYMAPEQAASKPVGPEADLYAMGVILYQALAGKLPYIGPAAEVLYNKTRFEPAPPNQLADGIPDDLNTLCVELLRLDPKARPGGREVLRRLGVTEPYPSASMTIPSLTQALFVGRERELEFLWDAFHESQGTSGSFSGQGRATTVLCVGESGIGKSALVRHFTDDLAAQKPLAVVLFGRCYERESVPYKAFDGIVDALAKAMMRLADAEAAALLPLHTPLLSNVFPVLRRVRSIAQAPGLPYAVQDPQEQRSRVFAALRELLLRLCARHIVVLVIDDLQWADADSMLLLSSLLRPPEEPPLLLIATSRVPIELPVKSKRLNIEGLPGEKAAELAELLLSRASPDIGDPALIAKEARGHPLFIDELVRYANDVGEDKKFELDEALWARVTRLEPPARRLLEAVCVAGSPIGQDVAARAAELEPIDFGKRTSALRVANLVKTGGARLYDIIEPYHDRVREAVITHLADDDRRQRHQELAAALEASGRADPEALATHWVGAGDKAKGADYAEKAAQGASAALAFGRAARLYARAIELEHPDANALKAKLGEALANAGRGKDAADAYLLAAEHASSADALEYRRRAAEQLLISGHTEQGLSAVKSVLSVVKMELPETPRAALISLLKKRARLRLRGLRFQERDSSAVPRTELTRIDTSWSVGIGLGMVDTIRGADFGTRNLLFALQAGEPSRIQRALGLEACFSASGGSQSGKRTEALLEAQERLTKKLGTPYATAWSLFASGFAKYMAGGGFEEALDRCDRASETFRDRCSGVSWELDSSQLFSLWALYYLGRTAELQRRVPRLFDDAKARGNIYAATNLRTGFPNLAWLSADQVEAAKAQVTEAESQWTRGTWWHAQHYWAWIARGQIDMYSGDGKAALARSLDFWPALERSLLLRIQMARVEAFHLRARSALAAAKRGDQALARSALRDAKQIEKEPVNTSRPMAQLLRAGAAAVLDQPEQAIACLVDAAKGFDATGMALYAASARRRQGEIVGGDEGKALIKAADEYMASQRVRRPDRMADLFAPGFPEK